MTHPEPRDPHKSKLTDHRHRMRGDRNHSTRHPLRGSQSHTQQLEEIIEQVAAETEHHSFTPAQREVLSYFGVTDRTLQNSLYDLSKGKVAKQLIVIAEAGTRYDRLAIAQAYFSRLLPGDDAKTDHIRAQLIRLGLINEESDFDLDRYTATFALRTAGAAPRRFGYRNAKSLSSVDDVGMFRGEVVVTGKSTRQDITPRQVGGSVPTGYDSGHLAEHEATRSADSDVYVG